MEWVSSLILDYTRNPVNKYDMQDYTVKRYEDNYICWDDIIVYLKIEDNKIKEYSFSWEPAMITAAVASILAEEIIGYNIDDVLKLDYNWIKQLWVEVTPKRQRAAVLALLATQNAILEYKKSKKFKKLEDLIN